MEIVMEVDCITNTFTQYTNNKAHVYDVQILIC